MKKTPASAMLILLLLAGTARAEGVWTVKGHAFSNVHAWQNGPDVRVSGRISGGPARSPFQAVLHVRNEDGVTHRVGIRMQTFTGQGETFEAGFRSTRRARCWEIAQIDVIGEDPALFRKPDTPPRAHPAASLSWPESLEIRGTSFPLRRDDGDGASRVLFSCMTPVCVSIRDLRSGRLVLMKNVSPRDLQETPLRPGRYAAEIVGDGFTRRKEFEIGAESETIDLN